MKREYHRFKLRMDRKNDKGEHPLNLIITKNRKRIFISLDIDANPELWDTEQQRFVIRRKLRKQEEISINEDYKKFNKLLERYEDRIHEVIGEFDKIKLDWTLNQFKSKFLYKPKQGNVKTYFQKTIKDLKEARHIGNSNCYSETLHMFELFDNKFSDKVFSEIDFKYINNFDIWLKKRTCKGNTRLNYIKTMRALFNKAIKDKEAQRSDYPFGKDGFSVNNLSETTDKRYLPTKYLEKLKNNAAKKPTNEFARNLFLFSYYCYGISFVDIAHLKQRNIVKLDKGEYIIYKREKNKNKKDTKTISIKTTPEIRLLIERLTAYKSPLSDYLLPIITVKKDNLEDLHEHIKNRRKKYVKYLKSLAKEFKMNINLTSYVSRHTLAMQLQSNNIPESVISQILGHKDLSTTKIYLDSLDTSVIDKAAEVL